MAPHLQWFFEILCSQIPVCSHRFRSSIWTGHLYFSQAVDCRLRLPPRVTRFRSQWCPAALLKPLSWLLYSLPRNPEDLSHARQIFHRGKQEEVSDALLIPWHHCWLGSLQQYPDPAVHIKKTDGTAKADAATLKLKYLLPYCPNPAAICQYTASLFFLTGTEACNSTN